MAIVSPAAGVILGVSTIFLSIASACSPFFFSFSPFHRIKLISFAFVCLRFLFYSFIFVAQNNYGRPDEVIAAETLANHIRCNNSFVQAVFQAQFRSSLSCPRCHKQSNTFDPFHCISVQLPQLAQQFVFVTVLYAKQHPRQVKLGLSVPLGSPIVALREQLQADTGIPLDRMILTEIHESGFVRVFCDSQPISMLSTDDSIYCIETVDDETNKVKSPPVTTANNDTTTKLTLILMNVKRLSPKDNDVQRFSTPFCVQVNRDISYTELQKTLLKEMRAILKSDVFTYATPANDMFKIRLQDPSADPDTYIEPNVRAIAVLLAAFFCMP